MRSIDFAIESPFTKMRGAIHLTLQTSAKTTIQREAVLPNWKAKVRKRALRKHHRKQKQIDPQPIVETQPELLTSDALRWRGEPWKLYRQELRTLQKRIHEAIKANDIDQARQIQLELLESKAVKSLAVRRIAFNHPQRRMPGIDGQHSLDETQQRALRDELSIEGNVDPFDWMDASRAWNQIRSAHDENESICLCTLRDRARQVLLSWALEPEWEALFCKTNILSHRPGRSTKEFLHWIQSALNGPERKCILAVDVMIDSSEAISSFFRSQLDPVASDLCCEWISKGLFRLGLFPEGIGKHAEEQSCPILPLLSNMICYDILRHLNHLTDVSIASRNGTLILIASASSLKSVESILNSLASEMGWKAKIRIPIRSLADWMPLWEFDFKQIPKSNGFGSWMRPRDGILERHLENLRMGFRLSLAFHEDKTGLIHRLNPIIRNFTDHFSLTDAFEAFEAADTHLKQLICIWAVNEFPSLTEMEAIEKAFNGTQNQDLDFQFKTRTVQLQRHGDAMREIQDSPLDSIRSPYDFDPSYWKNRLRQWECKINPAFA